MYPTGTLVPQAHGGALRYGGANRGGPGRPPDAFKLAMQELTTLPEVAAHLRAILTRQVVTDPEVWLAALKFAAERGWGKPAQVTEGEGGQGLTIRLVREVAG